jgi:hypothetical protein
MTETVRFKPLFTLAAAVGLSFILGASLSGCAPVSYDRDDTVTIPPNATVAFGGDKYDEPDDLDPSVDDDTVHGRIQTSIINQLQSSGYTMTRDAQSADLLVRYFIALRREPVPATTSGALARSSPVARPGWGWGWSGNTVTTITPQDFSTDSFVVELVERSTGRIAWRAVWRGEPGTRAPGQQEIDDKMSQIFRTLPAAP